MIYLAASARHHRNVLSWNIIEDLLLLAKSSALSVNYNPAIDRRAIDSGPDPHQGSINQEESTEEKVKEKYSHPLTLTSSGVLCLTTMGLRLSIIADSQSKANPEKPEGRERHAQATKEVQMVFTEQEAKELELVHPVVAYGWFRCRVPSLSTTDGLQTVRNVSVFSGHCSFRSCSGCDVKLA